MKSLSRQGHLRNRLNMKDKAKNSSIEYHLTTAQLSAIADGFVPLPNSLAIRSPLSNTAALGHRLSFLLSYAAALRGESTRLFELSDLSTIFAEKEGANGATLVVMTLGQGKTNKFGKYDRTAIMRHRRVELCAQGGLALYLFCRFHLRGEQFPSFQTSKDWFFNKILQPTKEGRRSNKKEIWKGKGKAAEDRGEESDESVDEDRRQRGENGDEYVCRAINQREADIDGHREWEIEREASRLFAVNDATGTVDLEGELIARAEAGPCIANAVFRPSDIERKQVHSITLEEITALPFSKSIDYETQRKAHAVALERAGVRSSRVTHLGRAAAASMVGQEGKDLDNALRRHGHWNKDVLSNSYLDNFRESRRKIDHQEIEHHESLKVCSPWRHSTTGWV